MQRVDNRGRRVRSAVILGVVGLVGSVGAAAQTVETLAYTLRPDPQSGQLTVELEWATGPRTQSGLYVAQRWGDIPDIPSLIRNVRCSGGQLVRNGNQWIVQHLRGQKLTLTYEVDPGVRGLDWDHAYLPITTRNFFHGFGNAFLITPLVGGAQPESYEVIVRWRLPSGWKAVCSWGRGPTVGAQLAISDLRNSVYLAGELKTQRIERDGLQVDVALFDRFRFNVDDFAKMAAEIVAAQVKFMGAADFPPFVVTCVPCGDPLRPGESRLVGSGLYHSFALLTAPKSVLNDAVEHLFAHELFHYWNGRLLTMADPEKEVAWFYEGLTDYYALRILYEEGVWHPAVYAKWINKHIRGYYDNPAIHATNEEIARDFWRKRDTVGQMAYQRGLLLGLYWRKLAEERGVPGGFDRLFTRLLERGRAGGFELSNAAVRATGVQVLGPWFADEFDRYVVRAERIDLPADVLGPPLRGAVTPTYQYEPGFDVQRSLRERVARGVAKNGPAYEAGLREGDQLLGWRVSGEPDEATVLQIERGPLKQAVKYLPRGKRKDIVQFTVRKQEARDRPGGEGD